MLQVVYLGCARFQGQARFPHSPRAKNRRQAHAKVGQQPGQFGQFRLPPHKGRGLGWEVVPRHIGGGSGRGEAILGGSEARWGDDLPPLQYRLQFGPHQPHAGDALVAVLFQHAVDQVGQTVGHIGASLSQVGDGLGEDGCERSGEGFAHKRQFPG